MNPDDPECLAYIRDRVADCTAILSEAMTERAARSRRPAGAAAPRLSHASDEQLLAQCEAIMRANNRFSSAAAVRAGMLRKKLTAKASL